MQIEKLFCQADWILILSCHKQEAKIEDKQTELSESLHTHTAQVSKNIRQMGQVIINTSLILPSVSAAPLDPENIKWGIRGDGRSGVGARKLLAAGEGA